MPDSKVVGVFIHKSYNTIAQLIQTRINGQINNK
jgi:hypothetical protein